MHTTEDAFSYFSGEGYHDLLEHEWNLLDIGIKTEKQRDRKRRNYDGCCAMSVLYYHMRFFPRLLGFLQKRREMVASTLHFLSTAAIKGIGAHGSVCIIGVSLVGASA